MGILNPMIRVIKIKACLYRGGEWKATCEQCTAAEGRTSYTNVSIIRVELESKVTTKTWEQNKRKSDDDADRNKGIALVPVTLFVKGDANERNLRSGSISYRDWKLDHFEANLSPSYSSTGKK